MCPGLLITVAGELACGLLPGGLVPGPRAKCAAAASTYSAIAVAATAPRLLVKVTCEPHRPAPARFATPAWV